MIRTFSGVRPTLYGEDKIEDKLSRSHRVYDHEAEHRIAGLVSLGGGKLASYRIFAEEAVDFISTKLRAHLPASKGQTHLVARPGGDARVEPDRWAKDHSLPPFVVARMAQRHGSRTPRVLDLIAQDRKLSTIVCPCDPVTEAEVRYSIRSEMARTLPDLTRRCKVGQGPCQGTRCAVQVASIAAEELGLSSAEERDALLDWLRWLWRFRAPILDGTQLQQEELQSAALFLSGGIDA